MGPVEWDIVRAIRFCSDADQRFLERIGRDLAGRARHFDFGAADKSGVAFFHRNTVATKLMLKHINFMIQRLREPVL